MSKEVVKIIGLTGPVGAGKDEVVKILRRRRIPVIDADHLAHTLYIPQSPLWHKLVKAFGSRILNRGGKINRKKLGGMVFGDRRKLKELNRLAHPYLKKEIIKIAEKQKAESSKPVVINAAVLKEIGLVDYVDEVWVVMASKEIRLKRLMKSGLSKKEAQLRMRSQMSRKEYIKIGTVRIENDGTRRELKKKVLALL
jgi:dephospho-CoA kinase